MTSTCEGLDCPQSVPPQLFQGVCICVCECSTLLRCFEYLLVCFFKGMGVGCQVLVNIKNCFGVWSGGRGKMVSLLFIIIVLGNCRNVWTCVMCKVLANTEFHFVNGGLFLDFFLCVFYVLFKVQLFFFFFVRKELIILTYCLSHSLWCREECVKLWTECFLLGCFPLLLFFFFFFVVLTENYIS